MDMKINLCITACVVLLVHPCRGEARARAGLFDMFSGKNENEGRSMQPSFPSIIPNSFNLLTHNSDYDDNSQQSNNKPPQTNINLVSLFPQNHVPVSRSGLDPETRVELTEQKEKLENILQKLQEMNKQKEEEKERQQQENGNFNNLNPNRPIPGGINNNNFNQRPMPNNGNNNNFNPNINRPLPNDGYNNFNPNRPLPNNGNNNNFNPNFEDRPTPNPSRPGGTTKNPVTDKAVPTQKPAAKKIWKKLMTKKFMFQAKPVKPENEIADLNNPEALYYVVE